MKFFFNLFSLIFILFSFSQAQLAKMSVSGRPQKSSDEIVGRRDANGRFCAAIQVISDMDGFKYQSYNGVVDVDDLPGKDMVYLQPDERVLEIYKSGYEPLKIILSEYGIQLKPKAVWIIKIKGQAKASDLIHVTLDIQPKDADVAINGKTYRSGDPIKLSKGSHRLRISKQGFKVREETINVSDDNYSFDFSLSEVELEQVLIKSIPSEARIYLDNVEKGLTDDGFFLYPGSYQLKLSKTGYLEVNETITVTEGGSKGDRAGRPNTFSYNLSKNSGTLTITVNPSGAKVLINKEDYTSRSQIDLAPGRYKIEISKTGYYPQNETITIERGRTLPKTFTLTAQTGKLQFKVKPLNSTVTLKQNGRTVQSWTGMKYIKELQVGSYELECAASGYSKEIKRVTISEGKASVIDIQLSKGVPAGRPNVSGDDMVFVKGGSFQMGSNDGGDDEKPVHSVTVNDFYIGKYEVTNAEYCEFLNAKGNQSEGGATWLDINDDDCKIEKRGGRFVHKSGYGNHPVIEITWYGAKAYCAWKGGRLPTESEWEYAAKGGQNSRGYKYSGGNNIGDVAWYTSNSGGKTHPAGKKKPNELGIYDMSGNVWEWCNDWYGSDYYKNSPSNNPKGPSSGGVHVLRGGSWRNHPSYARTANRVIYPDLGFSFYGFRLVMTRSSSVEAGWSETAKSSYETGTVTDIDGNVYKTVKIGNQVWMSENLKVTRYRNGDPIPNVTGQSEWENLSRGAYCNYDNNSSNVSTYGRLYNWYAVNDRRNIDPEGWHVPTAGEWQTLIDYLGGEAVAGGKMKERGTGHWKSLNKGVINSSGFSALPGGYRDDDGEFDYLGYVADYWSATQYDSYYAWARYLSYDSSGVGRYDYGKHYGFSVRCVRDLPLEIF